METIMGDRSRFEAISVDWEMAARAQGLACVVCKDTPTDRDREKYFATGLCLACATAIMAPKAASPAGVLEH
jgi:hypothetical protein